MSPSLSFSLCLSLCVFLSVSFSLWLSLCVFLSVSVCRPVYLSQVYVSTLIWRSTHTSRIDSFLFPLIGGLTFSSLINYSSLSKVPESLLGDRDFLLNELKPALDTAGVTYERNYMTPYFASELQQDVTFMEVFTAYH
jgi:hypothetical protein